MYSVLSMFGTIKRVNYAWGSICIGVINNKARLNNWCKIPSDGVQIGSGTITGDLGGINIWTLWSNGNWWDLEGQFWYINLHLTSEYVYSVSHIITYPSKELCSKMALGVMGMSLPWWCHALILPSPGYSRLFLNLIIFW